jgi:uncharacterized Zn-finger protein
MESHHQLNGTEYFADQQQLQFFNKMSMEMCQNDTFAGVIPDFATITGSPNYFDPFLLQTQYFGAQTSPVLFQYQNNVSNEFLNSPISPSGNTPCFTDYSLPSQWPQSPLSSSSFELPMHQFSWDATMSPTFQPTYNEVNIEMSSMNSPPMMYTDAPLTKVSAYPSNTRNPSPPIIGQFNIISSDLCPRPYTCQVPNCHRSFKRSEHLIRHHRCVHTNLKPYKCKYPSCKKTFSRSDNLHQHELTHTTKSSNKKSKKEMGTKEGFDKFSLTA